MNNLKHIAKQTCTDHDKRLPDLLKKKYSWEPDTKAMKEDFCQRCRGAGYSAKEIAEFLDYNVNSVYKLIGHKDQKKYERILQHLKTNGAVHSSDYSNLYSSITILRDKGHHIYRDGQKYKLA